MVKMLVTTFEAIKRKILTTKMKEFSRELKTSLSLRVLQHNSMECVNEQSIETNLSPFVKQKRLVHRKVEACKRGDHFSA
jgi:hypothetical protein